MADDDTTMKGRLGSLFSLQGLVVVSILGTLCNGSWHVDVQADAID